MEKHFRLLVAVVVVVIAAGSASAHDLFEGVFHLDCDGTVTIMNNAPFGIAIKTPLLAGLDAFINSLKSRADCACPDESSFDLFFDPVAAILNDFQPEPAVPDDCMAATFQRSLYTLRHAVIVSNFPDTCNYDTWSTTGLCRMQYSLPDVDMNLQLQVQKCDGSYLPSVLVSCGGDDCSQGLSFCRDGNDCSDGVECVDLLNKVGDPGQFETADDVAAETFSGFQGWIYATQEDSPGCFNAKRGSGAATPQNDIMAFLTNYVYVNLMGWSGVTNTRPLVCDSYLLNTIINATCDDYGSSYSESSGSLCADPNFRGFDSDAIVVTDTDEPLLCFMDNDTVIESVSLTYLKPLSTAITLANPIAAPAFAQASMGSFPLLHTTCDMQVQFLDRVSVRMNSKLVDFVNDATTFFNDLSSCRYSRTLNFDQWVSRYIIPSPLFLLGIFDATAAFDRGPNLPDDYDVKDALDVFDVDYTIVNFPPEFTQSFYIQNGYVKATWGGISSLLGLDVDLQLTVTKCDDDDTILNSYSLDCSGADCVPLLSGLTPCSPSGGSGQCPTGLRCDTISNFLDSLGDDDSYSYDVIKKRAAKARSSSGSGHGGYYGYGGYYAPESAATSTSINIFGLASSLLDGSCDISQAVFAEGDGPCSEIDIDWDDETSPCFQESTCFGPSKWQADINTVMMTMFGNPSAGSGEGDELHYCIFDTDALEGTDFDAWSASLADVNDDNTITVHFFRTDDSSSGSSDSSDAMVSAPSLLVMVTMLAGLIAAVVSSLV